MTLRGWVSASARGRAAAFVADRVARPFIEFTRIEAAGAIVLFVASVVAVVWANSPWDDEYIDLWSTVLTVDLGIFEASETLREWVNDGLMTLFFFVVGLEIKRELVLGELADRRRALLPVVAALGGMAVPAAIFLAFNAGGEAERGWGIPMATDIAFAVGVLTLAGARVPLSLRVFLLALAIVDDIGAIAVIAVFYTEDVEVLALAVSVALLATVLLFRRFHVDSVYVYLALGVGLWAATFESGIHPTIAGVALGMLAPALPTLSRSDFARTARILIDRFDSARLNPEEELAEDEQRAMLRSLERLSRETESPLERLEHALQPWVAFAIIPLFALANAGVRLDGDAVSGALEGNLGAGVFLGLVVGKPVGILLFAWLAVLLGLAALPEGVRWLQVAAVAVLGGIGFTVSLFITDLAFEEHDLLEQAKLATFAASLLSALVGFLALRLVAAPLQDRA